MINLSATQSVEVIATLKEKSPNLLTTNYTWRLYNKDSHQEYVFSVEDHTNSPYYDAFTISVGTPSNATGSSVRINAPAGTYNYFVYQMTNPYDLNINNALAEVENGILTINGTSSPVISFTQSDDDVIRVFNEL